MSGNQEVCYLEVDGLKRRYVLYQPDVPPSHGPRRPAIIMMDGRGGTPWTAMRSSRWNQKADSDGLILIYPEATRIDPEGPLHFLTNPQMWNAGTGGSDTERSHVNDLLFLERVLEDAVARAEIDADRIYMCGFSNGAAMTWRFAVERPGLLAGIGPVAGHFRLQVKQLSEPVPMICFFGRLDPLSPYEGGEVELPWGLRESRPPALASVHAWARLCGHEPQEGRVEKEPGLSRLIYGRPGERNEIQFITVDDLGHTWPGGHRLLPEALVGPVSDRVTAVDEMWDFFHRHRR